MASQSIAASGNLRASADITVGAQANHAPWYIWCAALAVTSVVVGGHWDISWHSSIGRDTFWTPAHVAIYMCGVLAGISFGYLILSTTFSRAGRAADAVVHVFGFRGPLGAFLGAWGGITMLTSAPFDNWWHGAYGLDVKILSPPHVVLFIGIYGVLLGTLVLIAREINRGDRSARWLFLYVNGLGLVLTFVVIMELTGRAELHDSGAYIAICLTTPIPLAVASRVTGFKFATTAIASFYMLFLIGLILILPLFPAEPKLGPVYQNVTVFIPPQFPILIAAPALALDLLWRRTRHWNQWLLALLSAAVFLAVLLALEWPFATFLMSSAARTRFFGTMYFPYGLPPTMPIVRGVFNNNDSAADFWVGILTALGAATLTMRLGFSRGDWMSKIKR